MVDEPTAVIVHVGGPVPIVGCSDGGIVDLLQAPRQPKLVGRLVVIGANCHSNVLSSALLTTGPSRRRPTSNVDPPAWSLS